MRMSLTIDERVLDEAQRLSGKKTKSAVIREALEEYIRKKRREEAIRHAGQIQMDITLEDLLRLREMG